MEVLCENCKAKFKIAHEKLPAGRAVSLKCPECKTKMQIKTRPGAQVAAPATTPKTTIEEVASDAYDVSAKPFDFVEQGVETALICEQDGGIREKVRSNLQHMGYHVTEAGSAQVALNYMRFHVFDLVVIDENFERGNPESNRVLQYLGHLPMNTRRNLFVVLLGYGLRTGDNLMALYRSVNLVVNLKNVDELKKVLKVYLAENEEFYRVFKESLKKVGRA